MSIHETEAGLTFGDYTLLGAARNGYDYQVVAHRYNLDFDTTFTTTPSSTGRDWDAVELDEALYRLAGTDFQRLVISGSGSGWQSVAGYSAPGTVTGVTPYALVADASGIHVFVSTTDGIQKAYWNLSSWSSWEEVTTDVPAHFAATSPERVHYLLHDSVKNLHELRVVEKEGELWSETGSGIHWGFPIDSFDAVALSDRDVLVMATDMPGMLTAKAINRKVVKSVLNAGGLMAFNYANGVWSDHTIIEKLDEQSDWNRREAVRLTKIDDTVWCTCLSRNGTRLGSFTRYRAFRTVDGETWTRGELLPVTHVSEDGLQIFRAGAYAVALERSRAYRSASTLLTGLSTVTLDITNWVTELKVVRQDMAQVQLRLDNKTGWVSSSILSGLSRCLLYVYGGAWVDNPKRKVLTLVGVFEVDTYGNPKALTENAVHLTGRDFMAWLSSTTQSESFLHWEPQALGADDHTDTTGTSYGGLSHTAVMSGEWMTENGKLLARSNDKLCIALATFNTELWNGDAQVALQLTGGQSLEYAGLLFWAQDKDNWWSAAYYGNSQRLEINEMRGGQVTFHTATPLGSHPWGTNRRFLRVEVYYAQIRVYTSEDGINWTEDLTYLAPGKSGDTIFLRQGAFGYIAYGYSDRDNWSDDTNTNAGGEIIDVVEETNPSDEWCYEWYFPTDGTGGWVADDNATFVPTEGWAAFDKETHTFRIRRSADQAFYLKSVEIEGNIAFTDPFGDCDSPGMLCIAITRLYGNTVVIRELPSGGFATAISLPSPQPMSTVRLEWAFYGAEDSDWNTDGRITRIRLRGVGYNPFGDNCT